MPCGNGRTTPSAVANGVIEHSCVTPSLPPQSASLLQGWKRFWSSGVLVWQSFGPWTASIWYVPGMPCPSFTSGSQTALLAGMHAVGFTHGAVVVVVVAVVLVVVVVVVGQESPDARGMQISVRTSLSVFLGRPVDEAVATTLHLPGLVPFLFSVTMIPESGPQLAASPAGENASAAVPPQFPVSLTGSSAVPVQRPAVRFAHS